MTGDEFHARYALLDPIAGDGARSFHAVTPGGRVAMVHFLDGGVTQANLELLSALERLEPGRRERVREVTAVDGVIAVVTELIPDFRSLSAWLDGSAAEPERVSEPATALREASTSAPSADPSPQASISQATGEFTRLFRAMQPSSRVASAAAAAPRRVDPPAVDPLPDSDSMSAPGSTFDQAPIHTSEPIQAGESTSAPESAQAPGSTSGPASAQAAEPARPDAGDLPAGGASGATWGEFTRLFRTPDANGSAVVESGGRHLSDPPVGQEERLTDSGAPPVVSQAQAGGEIPPPPSWQAITRVCANGSDRAVDAVLPEPRSTPVLGGTPGATGVFEASSAPAADGSAQPRVPDAPPGGAFTRLFERQAVPEWPASRPAGDPLPRSVRTGPARPDDDDYLERLHTPSAVSSHPPAYESAAAPQAPAPGTFSPAAVSAASPFGSPTAAAPPPPAATSTPALPARDAARSSTTLVAALVTVAVLAIVLILVVLLR